MEGFGGPAHPSLAIAQCLDGDTQMEPRGLERFMGRQLGFVCAWRVSGARGSRLEPGPPPSGVLLGGLSKYPVLGPFP
jgi:hypothetical protein